MEKGRAGEGRRTKGGRGDVCFTSPTVRTVGLISSLTERPNYQLWHFREIGCECDGTDRNQIDRRYTPAMAQSGNKASCRILLPLTSIRFTKRTLSESLFLGNKLNPKSPKIQCFHLCSLSLSLCVCMNDLACICAGSKHKRPSVQSDKVPISQSCDSDFLSVCQTATEGLSIQARAHIRSHLLKHKCMQPAENCGNHFLVLYLNCLPGLHRTEMFNERLLQWFFTH